MKTDSFEAWSLGTKGYNHFNRMTKVDNQKAIEYFEQALQLDPDFAVAWLFLAWAHFTGGTMGYSESPGESIKRAREIYQKTSEHWPEASRHSFRGEIFMLQNQHKRGIAEREKAVALSPNSSREQIVFAAALNSGGRPEEAIAHAKIAMRLEPYHPARFLSWVLAPSYDQAGRYEEALAVRKQLLERAVKGEYTLQKAHLGLATGYARLDRMEEARAHAKEVLKIVPNFSVKKYRTDPRFSDYKDQDYVDSYIETFSKAGLPD